MSMKTNSIKVMFKEQASDFVYKYTVKVDFKMKAKEIQLSKNTPLHQMALQLSSWLPYVILSYVSYLQPLYSR